MATKIRVDEGTLRGWVLKAYQENRGSDGITKRVLDAIRQFLSGAPGGMQAGTSYWFEEDPPASIASFIEDLERASPGLARRTFEPLLEQVSKNLAAGQENLAENMTVFVSALAGALAVKVDLEEDLACALLSAAILGVHRLGPEPFAPAVE